MRTFKEFLLNKTNVLRKAYVWNTASSTIISFQTVIMLVVLSRVNTIDAGIVMVAYAVGNLFQTISKFGMRGFQVTDTNEIFTFGEYFFSRILTTVLMLFVSILYVVYCTFSGSYNWTKAIIVLVICLIKMVEGFEDVIHSMFQQKGRLDIAGKITTLRLIGYIILFIILFVANKNILLTFMILLFFWIACTVWINYFVIKNEDFQITMKMKFANVCLLLKQNIPLFICAFLIMYLGNAPKYTIDAAFSDTMQAQFNCIFMPVFVITLTCNYVFQPIVHALAEKWNFHETSAFRLLIYRQLKAIIVISALVIAGGYWLGLPVLSWMFDMDLSDYKTELLILLIGGSMLALANFLQTIIVTIRKQNWLVMGYVIACAPYWVISNVSKVSGSILNICLLYLFCLILLDIAFAFLIILSISKNNINLDS